MNDFIFFFVKLGLFFMCYKLNIFNFEILVVDFDFCDWLYGIKEGVWVCFICKNCYVYLKGCLVNILLCVLIGFFEFVIIRLLYMMLLC